MSDIKEDIKILKELSNQKYSEKLLNTLSLVKEEDEVNILSIFEKQAIENILNELDRLQKENEEWSKAYQEEKDKQFDLLTNSISKQVIRDKIEILEKLQGEFKNNDELRIKIIGLKELLEGE